MWWVTLTQTFNFQTQSFSKPDLVSLHDLTKEDILSVLVQARLMEQMTTEEKRNILHNKTVAVLFFEPSTRTRLSFETAVQNLGGHVIGFSDASASSTSKGETLSDTIKVIERYCDLIVMRHKYAGAARRAAEVSALPIINAGDGSNQHPTQALLDLYTIQKTLGKIDGLKVGFLGDLKYGRTVHSLALALAHFSVEQVFISPETLRLPSSIRDEVAEHVFIRETTNLADVLSTLDVLYVTRIQRERFADLVEYEKVKESYRIDLSTMASAKPTLKILHPLPRVTEIDPVIDTTPYACYFDQVAHGIPVREAVLALISKHGRKTHGA